MDAREEVLQLRPDADWFGVHRIRMNFDGTGEEQADYFEICSSADNEVVYGEGASVKAAWEDARMKLSAAPSPDASQPEDMKLSDALEQADKGWGMVYRASKPWLHRGCNTVFVDEDFAATDWRVVEAVADAAHTTGGGQPEWKTLSVTAVAAENSSVAEYLAQEERAHLQTIDQRDRAEEALSQAYFLITGRSPEWSNLFGYDEALEEIDDAQKTLREVAAPQAAVPESLLPELDMLDEVLESSGLVAPRKVAVPESQDGLKLPTLRILKFVSDRDGIWTAVYDDSLREYRAIADYAVAQLIATRSELRTAKKEIEVWTKSAKGYADALHAANLRIANLTKEA
jgi:hypothetical protein